MSDEPPVPPVDDDMEAQEVGTSDELVATSDSINAPEPETSTEPEPEPEPEPEAPELEPKAVEFSSDSDDEAQPELRPCEGEPPQQSVWQWRGDSAPPKKTQDTWVTYDARVCHSLEHAFAAQQLDDPVRVDDERFVDLRQMRQRRSDNPHRYRGVRRRQVLRSGYMQKKGGEDVWRSDGTLEQNRSWSKGARRNWKKRWVVLFADGQLELYKQGPDKRRHEALPSGAPSDTLQLRSPTGGALHNRLRAHRCS